MHLIEDQQRAHPLGPGLSKHGVSLSAHPLGRRRRIDRRTVGQKGSSMNGGKASVEITTILETETQINIVSILIHIPFMNAVLIVTSTYIVGTLRYPTPGANGIFDGVFVVFLKRYVRDY